MFVYACNCMCTHVYMACVYEQQLLVLTELNIVNDYVVEVAILYTYIDQGILCGM